MYPAFAYSVKKQDKLEQQIESKMTEKLQQREIYSESGRESSKRAKHSK